MTIQLLLLIPPYIRMLSSDWLMKGVFFLTILRFFSFCIIAGIFAQKYPGTIGKYPARDEIPSLNSL